MGRRMLWGRIDIGWRRTVVSKVLDAACPWGSGQCRRESFGQLGMQCRIKPGDEGATESRQQGRLTLQKVPTKIQARERS